jgi:hypothetical protein
MYRRAGRLTAQNGGLRPGQFQFDGDDMLEAAADPALDVGFVTALAWLRVRAFQHPLSIGHRASPVCTKVAPKQPNNYAVAADRGIIMNKEGSWEVGLQDSSGMLQTAFNSGTYAGCTSGVCARDADGMETAHGGAGTGTGCWNWWGHFRVPLHEWTHTAVTFDGDSDKHYVNGMLAELSDCPGDPTQSKRLNKTPQVSLRLSCCRTVAR